MPTLPPLGRKQASSQAIYAKYVPKSITRTQRARDSHFMFINHVFIRNYYENI